MRGLHYESGPWRAQITSATFYPVAGRADLCLPTGLPPRRPHCGAFRMLNRLTQHWLMHSLDDLQHFARPPHRSILRLLTQITDGARSTEGKLSRATAQRHSQYLPEGASTVHSGRGTQSASTAHRRPPVRPHVIPHGSVERPDNL